jgi:hypothetical protein
MVRYDAEPEALDNVLESSPRAQLVQRIGIAPVLAALRSFALGVYDADETTRWVVLAIQEPFAPIFRGIDVTTS